MGSLGAPRHLLGLAVLPIPIPVVVAGRGVYPSSNNHNCAHSHGMRPSLIAAEVWEFAFFGEGVYLSLVLVLCSGVVAGSSLWGTPRTEARVGPLLFLFQPTSAASASS